MKKVYLFFAFSFLLFSCGISTEELTKEVRQSMEAEYLKNETSLTRIKDLTLVKKNETEYSGILETEESPKSDLSMTNNFKYTIDVVYDGTTFKWETKELN